MGTPLLLYDLLCGNCSLTLIYISINTPKRSYFQLFKNAIILELISLRFSYVLLLYSYYGKIKKISLLSSFTTLHKLNKLIILRNTYNLYTHLSTYSKTYKIVRSIYYSLIFINKF